jgi:alpha-D-ribose 1-methylphosphonate 5-triphosphate synthase subunit PhnH
MVRETAYDEVFHGQRHFRSLLDSMARPGTVVSLERVDVAPPPGLNAATALTAFALLNSDVSFHTVGMDEGVARYITANTRAQSTAIDRADFIVADGDAAASEALEGVSCGTLAYPDTAATIVIQVAALSSTPIAGALCVTIEGPGVRDASTVWIRRLDADLLLALQARNAEFPLGIDAVITCADDITGDLRVLGLPRTARLTWTTC